MFSSNQWKPNKYGFKPSGTSVLGLCLFVSLQGCFRGREEQLWIKVNEGDPAAMSELADAYASPTGGGGIVKTPNMYTAITLHRKAAEKGYTPAMYELSQLLTRSISDGERVMWLKKGAELGNSACVTELIKGYTHGVYGIQKDDLEAFRWVRVGWQMSFKERQYDFQEQAKELDRLLCNYRAHLRIRLVKAGKAQTEIDTILAKIQ